ncbi:hypothetical protein PHMEG_0009320 [Phytophthora megakarya]|uniref:Uncharacterized protein n=1 Tax=Phytophthora megakarya TaxID=4795 RepID=A0A225WGJ2_9STRA|nr:hypothetical protein PHMEG_0009320 [Phytophthora megakarya]
MLVRRFSKVSRLPQSAKKVTNEAKTAPSQQNSADQAAEDTKTDPLSHFGVFRSMDNYVDVTLIQYNNEDQDSDEKP